MNYFTHTEAEKHKVDLIKYIGQTLKYAPTEESVSKVIDVQAQQTMNEINNYGELEYGYLVIIVFEKHSGLVPALFCEFNALPPIYATHEVLNIGEKNQVVTRKSMKGTWRYKNEADSLQVVINQDSIEIKGKMNGKDEDFKFSSNGHWLNYYIFMFMDNSYFMISSANKHEMEFCKIETPSVFDGKFNWKVKLQRG